ncbi:MerR family transcriptional regulator [Lactobacillus sp. DCY120]|uniref:MerR family transcriptional regulator n=1 Tax=Bombilactobacillus apium TaxID=2675299 RepID=A0A850R6D5_9LACO|nr:MerR family transcriptional regulator [Bombilactobacillus apium]NVY96105.1 MerR family transcriptional regulator [Bombilactobacillus apium]
MTETRYQISEFGKLVGLTPFTLRYYEQEDLLKPRRDSVGQRFYTQADQQWVEFLLHLKRTGMTIPELKQYVAWRAQGPQTIEQRLSLLCQVRVEGRKSLAELQESLTILNHKIAWYEGQEDRTIPATESFAAYLQRLAPSAQEN